MTIESALNEANRHKQKKGIIPSKHQTFQRLNEIYFNTQWLLASLHLDILVNIPSFDMPKFNLGMYILSPYIAMYI